MKKLLRHRKTGYFYSGGSWTQSAQDAEDFSNPFDLLRACHENQLQDVELVLRRGRMESHLPLDVGA